MLLAGHLTQVFHLAYIGLIAYSGASGQLLILIMLTLPIFVSNLAKKNCPLTSLSNSLLKKAGSEGFPSLADWIASFIGKRYTDATVVLVVCVSIAAGFFVRFH